ncbi:hypothetical protein CB1_000731038 [Camelus ferus]|nr:hypothetical protein CB1_000731038 [Camelus ferus]
MSTITKGPASWPPSAARVPRSSRPRGRSCEDPGTGPRLVFNRMNGRRPPAPSPSLEGTQETHTLAHEENGRFVSRAWQQVEQQLGGGPAGESGLAPVQSVERMPNSRLHNPVPIDLGEWWAQQFLVGITSCA